MRSYLSDLWAFVTVLVGHWQSYAGGLIAVLIGLFERLTKWRLRFWAYVGLFIFGFILTGAFAAWRDEHRQNETLRTERDDRRAKPDFHLAILGTVSGPLDAGGSQIRLVLRLSNKGAPSSVLAGTWILKVTTPQGRLYQGVPAVMEPGVVDERCLAGTETAIKFVSEDEIGRKASNNIDRNGHVEGVLIFNLPDLSAKDIAADATSLKVSAEDVTGSRFWVEENNASLHKRDGPSFTSGLHYPSVVLSEKCKAKV